MKSEKGRILDNLKTIEEYIKQSKARNTEIICFPEMSITGYIDPTKYSEAVLNINSSAIKRIVELSKSYRIAIIAGFVEKNPDDKPFITQIAAYNGDLLSVYRKNTIAEDEKEWFSSGAKLASFAYSGINIGLSICADIGNEAIFNEYAQEGIDIVFESAAPGLYGEQATRNWQSGYNWWKNECNDKLGKYARENQIYIVVSTQAGRTIDEDFPGGGYVFSPEGKCIYETTNWSEGILYATIKIK